MNVNVFLVDTLDATVGKPRADIVARVAALYKESFDFANAQKPAGGPHTFNVSFVTVKPAPAATDLIIYLLPSMFYSIITFDEKKEKRNNFFGDHWGFTRITPARGATPAAAKSEVICKSADGEALGSVVFHEIMHAKTGKDNAGLHGTGGLGAAVVEGGTRLNNQNKLDMAAAITKPVTPWLGGWDILEAAKRQRDSGDPMWDSL